jgi:amidase
VRDATALAEAVRRREVAPLELVEETLGRIETTEPRLNAFVTVCDEEARAAARGELPDGPFRGVPIAIKDLTDVAGVPTTYSSRPLAHNVPRADAALVRRLKTAGFVVIGKSNTPEFGSTAVTESVLNGACRNPWNLERTPGGSSGGAAAHVAAGVLPLAHGSDGGGSIRIPASCCGLFGIKPSRGRISPAPYGDGSFALSQSGPVSWTVRDAAGFLDAAAGYEPGDSAWLPAPRRPFAAEVGAPPGRLRIAWTTEPALPYEVEAPCAQAARDAAVLLEELGHEVVEQTPPWPDDEVLDRFSFLWRMGPALYPVDPAELEPLNELLARKAHETTAVEYARRVIALQRYARTVAAFWDDVDVVLTPTLAKLPVPVGWVFDSDDPWEHFTRAAEFTPFTPALNVTGQPAASVPFAEADGLPLGVQLIARAGDEATLIRLASQLEEARPWIDRRPPLWAA